MKPTYGPVIVVALCAAAMLGFAAAAPTDAAFAGGFILGAGFASLAATLGYDVVRGRRAARNRLTDATVTRLEREAGR